MPLVNLTAASRLPAIEPTYLTEDELQYELDIRSMTDIFDRARHRTAVLRDRMLAEARGTSLPPVVATSSSVETDLDLFQIEEKLRVHEQRLTSSSMEDTMREAHLNRLLHLVGRISRATFHSNGQFAIGERLWERAQNALDECRPVFAVVLPPLSELVPALRRPWNTTLAPIGAAANDISGIPSSNSSTMNLNVASTAISTTTSEPPPVPPRSNNTGFHETNPFRALAENLSLRRNSVPNELWSFHPSGASSPTVYNAFPPVSDHSLREPQRHGIVYPDPYVSSAPLMGSTFTYSAGHPIYSRADLHNHLQMPRTVPVSTITRSAHTNAIPHTSCHQHGVIGPQLVPYSDPAGALPEPPRTTAFNPPVSHGFPGYINQSLVAQPVPQMSYQAPRSFHAPQHQMTNPFEQTNDRFYKPVPVTHWHIAFSGVPAFGAHFRSPSAWLHEFSVVRPCQEMVGRQPCQHF